MNAFFNLFLSFPPVTPMNTPYYWLFQSPAKTGVPKSHKMIFPITGTPETPMASWAFSYRWHLELKPHSPFIGIYGAGMNQAT
jgi:hypothetical protein